MALVHYYLQEETDVNPKSTAGGSVCTKKYLSGRTVSAATFQREFELEDVLDYVKTGIGSIIEDEVTQRFDSEELKVKIPFVKLVSWCSERDQPSPATFRRDRNHKWKCSQANP